MATDSTSSWQRSKITDVPVERTVQPKGHFTRSPALPKRLHVRTVPSPAPPVIKLQLIRVHPQVLRGGCILFLDPLWFLCWPSGLGLICYCCCCCCCSNCTPFPETMNRICAITTTTIIDLLCELFPPRFLPGECWSITVTLLIPGAVKPYLNVNTDSKRALFWLCVVILCFCRLVSHLCVQTDVSTLHQSTCLSKSFFLFFFPVQISTKLQFICSDPFGSNLVRIIFCCFNFCPFWILSASWLLYADPGLAQSRDWTRPVLRTVSRRSGAGAGAGSGRGFAGGRRRRSASCTRSTAGQSVTATACRLRRRPGRESARPRRRRLRRRHASAGASWAARRGWTVGHTRHTPATPSFSSAWRETEGEKRLLKHFGAQLSPETLFPISHNNHTFPMASHSRWTPMVQVEFSSNQHVMEKKNSYGQIR